jgi:hypothetical protein
VAVVGKEFQKSRPDLVNAAHFGPIAQPLGIGPQNGHLCARSANACGLAKTSCAL